jgi:hypothetical protein
MQYTDEQDGFQRRCGDRQLRIPCPGVNVERIQFEQSLNIWDLKCAKASTPASSKTPSTL